MSRPPAWPVCLLLLDYDLELKVENKRTNQKTVININKYLGCKFLEKLWCCVAAGFYKHLGFINRVQNVNWPPQRISKADVSNVSPSSGITHMKLVIQVLINCE